MFISKKHLSRRTVLQGAGAAIALPLLDAMSPAGVAWGQTAAGKTPHRLAFVGFPHGAVMRHWQPAAWIITGFSKFVDGRSRPGFSCRSATS